MTTFSNKMRMGLQQLQALPENQRSAMLNSFIQSQVKFLATTEVKIESLEPLQSICSLANQPKVQNHIGTIHAAAMVLLAETATGMALGMNIPDDKIPVAKSMNIKFVKMAKGALRAVANLNEEQVQLIQTNEKGEVNIAVKVTDEAENEPLIAEIVWAWFPATKKEKLDDKTFLTEEIKKAMTKLKTSQMPNWGNLKAQEMVEHLIDVIQKSYSKPYQKGKEISEKQKQYKAFFYSDQPFPHNMKNPLFLDGQVPPLKNVDLETAKSELENTLHDFFTYFKENPEQTFFHYYAGEMSFQDLMRFHVKHCTHHLAQFSLL